MSLRLIGRFADSARSSRAALAAVDGLPAERRDELGELIAMVLRQLSYSLLQGGKKYGMQTMNDALYQLYVGRQVALEECLRVSNDPNELLRMTGQQPDNDPTAPRTQAAPRR